MKNKKLLFKRTYQNVIFALVVILAVGATCFAIHKDHVKKEAILAQQKAEEAQKKKEEAEIKKLLGQVKDEEANLAESTEALDAYNAETSKELDASKEDTLEEARQAAMAKISESNKDLVLAKSFLAEAKTLAKKRESVDEKIAKSRESYEAANAASQEARKLSGEIKTAYNEIQEAKKAAAQVAKKYGSNSRKAVAAYQEVSSYGWDGSKLTRTKGVNYGPTGKETYYNLNMSGVVDRMRRNGYSESEYKYWVREDGVKMLGDYVIVAANLNNHPRGSVVETSLGTGIVCDTGGMQGDHLDIATSW